MNVLNYEARGVEMSKKISNRSQVDNVRNSRKEARSRQMKRSVVFALFVVSTLFIIAGSAAVAGVFPNNVAENVQLAVSATDATGTVDPRTQEYVLNLLRRWSYEGGSEESYAVITREIRALPVEEARLFLYLNAGIERLGFRDDDPSFSKSVVPPHRQKYLLELASRALYGGGAESEIKALSGVERQLFEGFVTVIREISLRGNGASYLSDHDVIDIDVLLTVAEANDVSFLDISEDEFEAALRDTLLQNREAASENGEKGSTVQQSCTWPYVSCNYIDFTGATFRADCGSGWCIGGSGFDTVTEDPGGCELWGCDYRVWFSTPEPWNGVDGRTFQSNCLADKVPHAHRWDSRTEIEFGYGAVRSCGIFSGDYLVANMRVQR